jgi:hypothetical protein
MAKKSALVIGIVFILVGILGFIPGNGIVGPGATFETDALHNSIHLVFGLILLFVALKAAHKAAGTLKIVGVIYLLLAVIGFAQGDTVLGLVPVNGADNWLHLVLGVVIGALGFAGKGSNSSVSSASSVPPQM